jgi:hypothetical protein
MSGARRLPRSSRHFVRFSSIQPALGRRRLASRGRFLASSGTSWFSILEREAIHRGSFASVRDLMIKIRAFINGWNDRCHPSSGPSPPTKVLEKIKR